MKAELVPENGDPPIPINRDVTIVGRRDYCDVMIDHPSLSKRHCVLVKTDGLLVIRDLASTNGTKVKGQKIRWAALLPDDRLTMGSYKFRVYLGPDDAPGPSELSRWGGARKPGGSGDRAEPGASGGAGAGFSPPSPVETPAVPVGDDSWVEEDESGSSWRERLKLRELEGADAVDDGVDDEIIELE
jgi:hypothetical protein